MMLPLSDTQCWGGGGAGQSNYPFMTCETRNNWFVTHTDTSQVRIIIQSYNMWIRSD